MAPNENQIAEDKAKELHLVADTNLFFEFKKLEELPWCELNADPIVILVTKPVLDEIDKHKKSNGRTKDRVMSIFKMLRSSLKNDSADTVIQEKSPRVLLRHVGGVAPDEELRDKIDFNKNDDRLVGILSTLINKQNAVQTELFTDDTGPVSTAKGLNLPFKFIDDSWRRPPQQTSETKRIKSLEKDLEAYRAQEPDIKICYGDKVDDGALKIVRRVAKPLSSQELQSVLQKLKSKHPLENDFTPPSERVVTSPITRSRTKYTYEAPSQEEIDTYRDVNYPKWLDECQTIFGKLGKQNSSPEEKVPVSWTISNKGTRPATHVRIEFKAEGALALIRARKDDSQDDCEGEDTPSTQQQVLRLPSPPIAPTFRESKEQIATPNTKTIKGVDIAKLDYSGKSPSKTLFASGALGAVERSLLGPQSATATLRQFHNSPISRILESQQRFDSLINPPHLKAMTAFTYPTIESTTPRIDLNAFRAPEHDPEAFYFDKWDTNIPVDNGALTCDLWRHQRDSEGFEFEVLFTNDGDVRGAVLCTVHAENLTKPAELRLPVSREIEEFSSIDAAIEMIDSL